MIHVGLNLLFLTPGAQGGMEIYAHELIRRLAECDDLQLTAFVSHDAAGEDWGMGVAEVVVPVHPVDRKQWVVGEQVLLPRAAHKAGCGVVHSLAATAPVYGPFKRVTTIHDLMYKMVPDAHAGMLGHGMAVVVAASARRSHRIIASSQSTANDLTSELHVSPDKIDVVLLGVSPAPRAGPNEPDIRARFDLGSAPVILSVSAIRPSKNLARLIEAHAGLPDPRPTLVLPGYSTPYEAELRDVVDRFGTGPYVRFLGWVTAEDLEGLYRLATVFVFPSLYEGFGLPPLEAMARGVPVVTSDRGALKEVVGDATVIVDAESVTSIRDGLARVMADEMLRKRLRESGHKRAAQFTWDRTASETVASYRPRAGVADP